MNKTKAAQIVGILINQDFEPTIKHNSNNEFTITVAPGDGILVNTLKVFQDNNDVICKVRLVDIT